MNYSPFIWKYCAMWQYLKFNLLISSYSYIFFSLPMTYTWMINPPILWIPGWESIVLSSDDRLLSSIMDSPVLDLEKSYKYLLAYSNYRLSSRSSKGAIIAFFFFETCPVSTMASTCFLQNLWVNSIAFSIISWLCKHFYDFFRNTFLNALRYLFCDAISCLIL